jgi:hypothetical protein
VSPRRTKKNVNNQSPCGLTITSFERANCFHLTNQRGSSRGSSYLHNLHDTSLRCASITSRRDLYLSFTRTIYVRRELCSTGELLYVELGCFNLREMIHVRGADQKRGMVSMPA